MNAGSARENNTGNVGLRIMVGSISGEVKIFSVGLGIFELRSGRLAGNRWVTKNDMRGAGRHFFYFCRCLTFIGYEPNTASIQKVVTDPCSDLPYRLGRQGAAGPFARAISGIPPRQSFYGTRENCRLFPAGGPAGTGQDAIERIRKDLRRTPAPARLYCLAGQSQTARRDPAEQPAARGSAP